MVSTARFAGFENADTQPQSSREPSTHLYCCHWSINVDTSSVQYRTRYHIFGIILYCIDIALLQARELIVLRWVASFPRGPLLMFQWRVTLHRIVRSVFYTVWAVPDSRAQVKCAGGPWAA